MNAVKGGNDKVIVGDQRQCEVEKKGTLHLETIKHETCITLNDVRVVKEIGKNIISIGKLLKEGGKLYGDKYTLIVEVYETRLTFHKMKEDGLYYTKLRRLTTDGYNYCNKITTMKDDNNDEEWNKVITKEKKKWPKLKRDDAHARWGHPHYDQMNKMANFYKIRLTGKLSTCAGCGVVKSRAKQTTRTCKKLAQRNGERLFIDTTGPYPKSRGGMKYWMCAVDDRSDKTWTYFSTTKKNMVKFVTELITTINGLDYKVRYIRCDNAGEHQSALQEICSERGIILEYTAPNTPQQNARAEKKIHIVWQRAMTMMVNANLTPDSQSEFWAEAVACSNFIEDLVIKSGRMEPALAAWTSTPVTKWIKHLVQFGRIGIVNKRLKVSGKMTEKGFPAMMVGYAHNHGPGTYRLYNPKTKRIIMSKDVRWMDFKPKQVEKDFAVFEPGVESVVSRGVASGENDMIDGSSISTQGTENLELAKIEPTVKVKRTQRKKPKHRKKSTKKDKDLRVKMIEFSTSTNDSDSSDINDDESASTSNSSESSSSSSNDSSSSSGSSSSSSSDNDNKTDSSMKSNVKSDQSTNKSSRRSKLSRISKPRMGPRRSLRVRNQKESKIQKPAVVIDTPRSQQRKLRSNATVASKTSRSSRRTTRRGQKIVTGNTIPHKVTIFTVEDEGEVDNQVNLVSKNVSNDEDLNQTSYFFELSEHSVDRIYKCMNLKENVLLNVYTVEVMTDPETPKTIRQALTCEDKELWRKSATAEVNNFLKRNSWKFVSKEKVKRLGRKLIGVKWVFKVKSEPDYSFRYKSRVVSKGYMQVAGIDYNEKFSPVAQPSTVRVILAMVLYYYWDCELVDIEAAFLEGRLTSPTYLNLPPGLVELGFMTKEQFENACIELQGGMYGNVDAALLYFKRFRDFATKMDGLNLQQSKSDPCLFYRKNEDGRTVGVIVVYVDDCVIAGETDFISEMKNKLKTEFGVVEDGKLRKLLGVRYKWYDLDERDKAKVVLSMEDKANDIIKSYEEAVGETPRKQKAPGKPGEVLSKNEEEAMNHASYRTILGKLMFYVTKISPECSYACGQLARQMHNPGKEHWDAMGRMIGYLKGKERHELVINRPKNLHVISFGDASYGDCLETRRSSTGDIHTIGGSIVNWRAQKTKTVCLSSAEAEYIALSEMSKEQKFLHMLMEEVFEVELPCILYEDNEAATYLAKNQHVSARTKHIDIKEHYIREHLKELGEIKYIESKCNFADVLTKNVKITIFETLGKAILNGFIGYEDKFCFSNHQRENI